MSMATPFRLSAIPFIVNSLFYNMSHCFTVIRLYHICPIRKYLPGYLREMFYLSFLPIRGVEKSPPLPIVLDRTYRDHGSKSSTALLADICVILPPTPPVCACNQLAETSWLHWLWHRHVQPRLWVCLPLPIVQISSQLLSAPPRGSVARR